MNQHQKMATFDAEPGRIRAAAMMALVRIRAVMVADELDEDDALSAVEPPLQAITEPSIWSIGERITIRFGDHGAVWIQSRSRQWLTLFDWFVNRRNVHRIERLMRYHLTSKENHPSPPPPAPPAAEKGS